MAVALKISYRGMWTQAGNMSQKISDIYHLNDNALFDTKKNEAIAAITAFSEHRTSAFAALGDENATAGTNSVIWYMTQIGIKLGAIRTTIEALTVQNYTAGDIRRSLEVAGDNTAAIKQELSAINKAVGFA